MTFLLPLLVLAQAAPSSMRLEDFERMALAANPVIAESQALVEAAAGRAQQAGLWPNPTFGANGEHVSKNTFGGAIGGFVEQRFITAGKLGLDRRVALQEQSVAEQDRAAARQRLLNSVRMHFYQALGDQTLIQVRTELADLARRAVRTSQELFNVGQADRPDLLAAETEAEQIELELVNARNALDRSWRQLAAVVNQPTLKPVQLEGKLEDYPRLQVEAALERIYQESPELRAAEVEVRRAEFSIRRAEVERFPISSYTAVCAITGSSARSDPTGRRFVAVSKESSMSALTFRSSIAIKAEYEPPRPTRKPRGCVSSEQNYISGRSSPPSTKTISTPPSRSSGTKNRSFRKRAKPTISTWQTFAVWPERIHKL